MKLPIAAFVLPFFLLQPAWTETDHPFQISENLDEAIKQGLGELYTFNFDKSVAIFSAIEDSEAEHPMVAFGMVSTHWWRISSLVLEADAKESKPFLEAVNRCIKVSEAKIKKGDPTGEGHLVLGGALGMLGRWQATNGQWMNAYWSGKKAYKYLSKALTINPRMIDANMGKGIFDYYVATLPAMVRVLAFIGMGGNPDVGIQELENAASNGTYARTPSKLFLMQIYMEQQNNPEKALVVLKDLREEYPKSPFMHMMQIIALYNAGQLDNLKSETESFHAKIATKNYSNDFLAQATFAEGLPAFKTQQWKEAKVSFEKAFEAGQDTDPWKTWAALYAGFCNDVLGERDLAKARYRWVLDHLRRWGSHDLAKKRLKEAFAGTPEDLKKLAL